MRIRRILVDAGMSVLRNRAPGSREDFMTIVGCDFHPGWQQVEIFDAAMGEIQEVKPRTATVKLSASIVG